MRKRLIPFVLTLTLAFTLAAPAGAYNTASLNRATVISSSGHHAIVDSSGGLWIWGGSEYGALGCGDAKQIDIDEPVRVMENVVSADVGSYNSAAIKSDGSLWVWGRGMHLGNGTTDNSANFTSPVKILDNVAAVSVGDTCVAAIKTDGSLWMWGDNTYGQLGSPDAVDYATDRKGNRVTYQTTPKKIMDGVAAVSCGGTHVVAVKTDGTLWGWGTNSWGQMGNGGTAFAQWEPLKIMDNVVFACAGNSVTAAIKTDGSLWMCGDNTTGILGNGWVGNVPRREGYTQGPHQTIPVKVMDNVSSVSLGTTHAAAIKTDGSLWTWGGNGSGQLGNNKVGDYFYNERDSRSLIQSTPVKVMDDVAAVTGGNSVTLAVKTDGTVWISGWMSMTRGEAVIPERLPNLTVSAQSSWTPVPSIPSIPDNLAYTSTQNVSIDGEAVELQAYALKDENGNPTNYVKLRDVAYVLNGSAAQFNVGWDGNVNIVTGAPYEANGSEMSTPFSGDREYTVPTAATNIDGQTADLAAIVLTDDNGGAYTYYQLRDLGKALGFNVGWSADRGIFIESDQPYTDAN